MYVAECALKRFVQIASKKMYGSDFFDEPKFCSFPVFELFETINLIISTIRYSDFGHIVKKM